MRHKERKGNLPAGGCGGLLVTVVSFAGLLLLLTMLVKGGRVSESLLRLLLPLSCLLSGAAGVLTGAGKKETKPYSCLLAGAIPAVCLLCCGLAFAGGGNGNALYWNAAAFLIPALASLIPGGRKSHRRK